jgi:hypothetical protein
MFGGTISWLIGDPRKYLNAIGGVRSHLPNAGPRIYDFISTTLQSIFYIYYHHWWAVVRQAHVALIPRWWINQLRLAYMYCIMIWLNFPLLWIYISGGTIVVFYVVRHDLHCAWWTCLRTPIWAILW